jgi:hypothetical protein
VQDSARIWLGVLTTLLGLLGSVVLFKGGDLVTGVTSNGQFQFFLVLLVGLVFMSAILALIAGGAATWGGLGDIVPADEAEAAASQPVASPEKDNGTAGGKTDGRSRARRGWFRFWLLFAGVSRAEREQLLAIPPSSSPPIKEAWKTYRSRTLDSADRKRVYLHASRRLGVATAVLIAMLAILAVIAGTISPTPTEVIVIHGGRSSCVTVANSEKLTRVTQVIPVGRC